MRLKIIRRLEQWYGVSQIKRNGFWFVDIPRTSSTSLKVQLASKYGKTYAKRNKKYNPRGIFNDHLSSKRMIEILSRDVWDNLFTFTIIRNPWDRAVSYYQYSLAWHKKNRPDLRLNSFKQHIVNLKNTYNENTIAKRNILLGCYEFISYDNEIVVDKVIRFENRHEELNEISKKIGIDNLTSTHKHKTLGKKNYNEFYNNETRRIVEEIFAKDIEEFGYSFD